MMKSTVDYLSFFSCVTLLVPISRVEGQYSIWHVPRSAFFEEVNWGQFVLDHLMLAIHDFQINGGAYIQGCLVFLQV